MTRRSWRELERRVGDLEALGFDEYHGRPDELTSAEKAALDELFDVDPRGERSEAQDVLDRLRRQEVES